MIHICYGIYDKDGRYSKFCGTSIVSIFENTKEDVTVHILHDNTLTNENRDKFNYLANQYKQNIVFYNVEILDKKEIETFENIMLDSVKKFYSNASIYRFLIVKLIPNSIDKVIYLDAGDTIVNFDINNLWNININDYPCAAVPEILNGAALDKFLPMVINGTIKNENYFNSGVMVLNLNYMRKHNFVSVNDFAKFPEEYKKSMILFDQDLLNYHFSTKYLKLPQEYNAFVRWERAQNNPITEKVYHYTGIGINCRPEFDTTEKFNKLFLEYFCKTPWFNFDILGNIAESIRKYHNQKQNQFLQISNVLTQRKRAFFGDKKSFPIFQKIFQIKEDEEFIDFPALDIRYVLNLMSIMRGGGG